MKEQLKPFSMAVFLWKCLGQVASLAQGGTMTTL